jgi:hypothetical protein
MESSEQLRSLTNGVKNGLFVGTIISSAGTPGSGYARVHSRESSYK